MPDLLDGELAVEEVCCCGHFIACRNEGAS
jgi:hypothetical protein